MDRNTINQRTTQAKLLLVLSAICSMGLAPFIFFRAMQEDWAMVALDILIILGMIFVFIYVYRTNETKYPSLFFLLVAHVGSTISFYLNGGHMVNWIYPAILSTFFVAKPRQALLINFGILLVYAPKMCTHLGNIEIVVIVFSVSISNLITFRFTEGLRIQEKELKKIASEDYLTQTGNRRSLDIFLKQIWNELQKNEVVYSLIILDVDHFKKINDEYGHLVGDTALVNISKLIKQMIGEIKPVFRYGGEEFLIVCPCNEKEAFHLADSIRGKVKNTDLIIQTRMTISLGVAQYHHQETITQWMCRVDKALYQAKNQGRDCVIKV